MKCVDIVLPVYNEADNLPRLLERLDNSFKKTSFSYSVIAIDDHSTDGSFDVLQTLSKTYPLKAYQKRGLRGKAYSILEAKLYTKNDIICMIDADLQYPPEAIPEMVKLSDKFGIVVARRTSYGGSLLRKVGSRTMAFVLGKLLLGITCDMQSGLKVFHTSILSQITEKNVSPWNLDLTLLHTGLELGYEIGEVEITFEKRTHGVSKLKLVGPSLQIISGAMRLKLKRKNPRIIEPDSNKNMKGAGILHKRQRFITHTTLAPEQSAVIVFTFPQKLFFFVLLITVGIGLAFSWLITLQILVAILSLIYFIDVIFNFFLILKSLHSPPEITSSQEEIDALLSKDLPIYSILCPLYKESHILPHFLKAIDALEWPKEKLDVMLLFEADDDESIEAVKHLSMPTYVRVVVVPHSLPKTKPKASNYGLSMARGEYVVIFDAEDVPDVLQLKKAYLGFQKVGPRVKCLQAKLNYYNAKQNLLTRFFTAEYSLWFDVVLTGLQSIETTIPLGGTSNHFRRQDLIEIQGWDPFNVTEDCDLGVRLFKKGYKTAIIESTTLEEANSNVRNWIRQRSRWIKGYMQTYLLHMRQPLEFVQAQGIHALFFQLTVGGKLAFVLINPILWLLTVSYFVLNRYVGSTIESLYPSLVFYMAATSLLLGNFMYIYYYMIGCAKREHWWLIKWVFLVPLYWLLVSMAAFMALYQLITKPYYWEKTLHGLHLKKQIEKVEKDIAAEVLSEVKQTQTFSVSQKKISLYQKIRDQIEHLSQKKLRHLLDSSEYRASFMYVVALFASNIINFATSAYLGNTLKFVDFGYMNTFISLLYLSNIFFQTYSVTVNYKVAFLVGKNQEKSARYFWQWSRNKSLFLSLIISGLWILSTPLLMKFFNIPVASPFLMFTPLIILSILAANDRGILKGKFSFGVIAIMTLGDPIARFLSTVLLTVTGNFHLLYLTIPLGIFAAFAIGSVVAHKRNPVVKEKIGMDFPFRFWTISILGAISGIAFFSLDNILASHFLTPHEVGQYALLGILGKMLFFIGSITSGFLLPIVARNEGKQVSSTKVFYSLLALITGMSFFGYIVFALAPAYLAPLYLGIKMRAIAPYLPLYGLGVFFFTVSQTFVSYHLAKKEYSFPLTAFVLTLFEILLFGFGQHTLRSLVATMSLFGFLNIVCLSLLHIIYPKIKAPLNNVKDFLDLFSKLKKQKNEKSSTNTPRILVFNWRDSKHLWGGGAEKYIHEIMSGLVKSGSKVTLFCGNDGKNPRNEVIDGVQVIRRGGFYTVYVWAFLYYVLRLRHFVDIIIDCENGIPFMVPLYSRKQTYLIIHHVHQEVFRKHLHFPLTHIALFIEAKLMPMLYQQKKIITVSQSSKVEIMKLGFHSEENIHVIEPGIDADLFEPAEKTKYPSMVYIGRLKDYKNLDTGLVSFSKVLKRFPTAKFFIAGRGEASDSLKALAKELRIETSVEFIGKVTESEKSHLFAKSWVALQPSMIEGWGITVIEANACGTPVIASNVNGLRDSIQDGKTGILFTPKKSDELTKHIEEMFSNNTLRRQLSKEAVEWSKSFVWSKAIRKFTDVIQHEAIIEKHEEVQSHERDFNV